MIALAGSVFVAALLGSVHCAGMCGGLACFVAGGPGANVRATAAYNAGRLVAYAALGAAAGLAGRQLDGAASALAPGLWTRPAAVVAGLLMVVWGTASALTAAGVRLPTVVPPAVSQRLLATGMRAAGAAGPAQRALALGVLTPLLPCGWLWAFVATAAAAGSPARGAMVMAAFWTGTVPAMAALGVGLQQALGPLRRRLPAFTSLALVVIGLLTVAGRFTPMKAHPHPTAPSAGAAAPAAVDGHHHR